MTSIKEHIMIETNPASKEVVNYAKGLKWDLKLYVKKNSY